MRPDLTIMACTSTWTIRRSFCSILFMVSGLTIQEANVTALRTAIWRATWAKNQPRPIASSRRMASEIGKSLYVLCCRSLHSTGLVYKPSIPSRQTVPTVACMSFSYWRAWWTEWVKTRWLSATRQRIWISTAKTFMLLWSSMPLMNNNTFFFPLWAINFLFLYIINIFFQLNH